VLLQAAFRGYQTRKFISLLKSKQLGSSRYFTKEESMETVSRNKYNPKQEREQRPPYTFKTGAVYLG